MPVGSLQEVDEVDTEGLLCLAQLPVLASAAPFQLVAEPAHLVHQGLVGGVAREEPAHPAHAIRRRLVPDQLGFEDELPELLQRRFHLAHGSPRSFTRATGLPLRHWRVKLYSRRRLLVGRSRDPPSRFGPGALSSNSR